MPKPFELFVGEDGRWYQAGIDGEAFEILSQETYSAEDVRMMRFGESSNRRLSLKIGEKALIRFIPTVLDEVKRYVVATHWWHGLPILCSKKTSTDLMAGESRNCRLCELTEWMMSAQGRPDWLEPIPHELWMVGVATALEFRASWELPVLKLGYFDGGWRILPQTQWVRPALLRLTPRLFDRLLGICNGDPRVFSYLGGFDWVLERTASDYTLELGTRGPLVPHLQNNLQELERIALSPEKWTFLCDARKEWL